MRRVYVPVRLAAAVLAVSALATGCVDVAGEDGDRARPARSTESGGSDSAGGGAGEPGGAAGFDPRVNNEGTRPETGGTRRSGRDGKPEAHADREDGERPGEAEEPEDGDAGRPEEDPGEPAPPEPGEPAPEPPGEVTSPAPPQPSPPPPSPDPSQAQPTSAQSPKQSVTAPAPEAGVPV
ncbi:hypothetical protein [Streptomyces abyssomicinicus]|uniref:hypothetical protein n=1 Tax=Streptomyces abyssomicinicus TaxID=574929 RepID=UPI00124FA942|nr:hypothetical protein [Streptomyces abyssomicinicus]